MTLPIDHILVEIDDKYFIKIQQKGKALVCLGMDGSFCTYSDPWLIKTHCWTKNKNHAEALAWERYNFVHALGLE